MKKKRLARVGVFLFCVALCVTSLAKPAHAWKVKTHVYSANLVLEEVKRLNGYVEIAPFGKIAVVPEYRDAILAYPDYFRAGAMAPDLLPDMIMGQTVIHPGRIDELTKKTTYGSGMILDNMFDLLTNMPDPAPVLEVDGVVYKVENRQQHLAFALGCLMHAAGDFFGHAYINEWAGGPWPEFSKLSTPEGAAIVLRHNAMESYIDSKIPKVYKHYNKNVIKVPQYFYYTAMVSDFLYEGKFNYERAHLDAGKASPFYFNVDPFRVTKPLPDSAKHLQLFYDVRKNPVENASFIESFFPVESLGLKLYYTAWMKDIDEGLIKWVEANARASQEILMEEEALSGYKNELLKWSTEQLASMLGAPDFIVDMLNSVLRRIEKQFDWLLTASVKDKINEIQADFLGYFFKQIFGIDIHKLIEIDIDPTLPFKDEKLFPAGTLAKLDKEMGNFKEWTSASGQTFVPFDNTLAFMKLILVGEAGVNQMRKMAGITKPENSYPNKQTITVFIDSLDVGYNWKEPHKAFDQTLWTFCYARNRQDRDLISYTVFNMNHKVNPRPAFFNVTPTAKSGIGKISASYLHAPVETVASGKLTTIGVYSKNQPYNPYAIAESEKKTVTAASGIISFPVPAATGKYQLRMYDQYGTLVAVSPDMTVTSTSTTLKPKAAPVIAFKPTPAPTQTRITGPTSWSGVWYTSFGPLELVQASNYVVTGTYADHKGQIHGLVSGNKLVGTLIEGGVDKGKFELTMAADRKSFTGKSTLNRYTTAPSVWDGIRTKYNKWDGVFTAIDDKVRPVNVADRWTGTWAAGNDHVLSLVKNGSNITGITEYGTMKISGTLVSDREFSGTYLHSDYSTGYDDRKAASWSKTGPIKITLSADYRKMTVEWPDEYRYKREIVQCYAGLPAVKAWTGLWHRAKDNEYETFMQKAGVVTGMKSPHTSEFGSYKGFVSGNRFKGVFRNPYRGDEWMPFDLEMSRDGLTYFGEYEYHFWFASGNRLK